MLADALAPHNGIVMWRAFVYSHEQPDDRAKQAYSEFVPLDGKFRENVLIQVKNGPIDFQPREPYHPLFGAMKETPLMMEFQITKEYLGQGTHLVGLATLYEEILYTDTYISGKGSTINKIIDGSFYNHTLSAIAGVANIGTSLNWTGHHFGQADWYAFGKLAWNPYLKAKDIYAEWAKLTFTKDDEVQSIVNTLLNSSHEICVNYMTPLGLHHIMAEGHHYGPGPWVADAGRADWTSVYYHKADNYGIGFNRSISGSKAIEQYPIEIQKLYGDENICPLEYLLWFHHVSWDKKLSTNRTLWEELIYRYYKATEDVSSMKNAWIRLNKKIDAQRYNEVLMHLNIQEAEAKWWRDACVTYFQTYSNKEIPPQYEKPKYNINYYKSLLHPYAPGIKPKW
jgi:alpha-glucuronidase